jgi:hypothetical protein
VYFVGKNFSPISRFAASPFLELRAESAEDVALAEVWVFVAAVWVSRA